MEPLKQRELERMLRGEPFDPSVFDEADHAEQ